MPETLTSEEVTKVKKAKTGTPTPAPRSVPEPRSFGMRVVSASGGVIRLLRSQPALSPTAYLEARRERAGGHPVDEDHAPHLEAAVAWLMRAQDATPDDGFSRGYSLTWNRYFRARGWQPSYPETTGYIIPTLYEVAHRLGRPELADRATRAARWSIDVQLPSGAVRGGVIGQGDSPAVFNTGQVILGWLSALNETGEEVFADAAIRAGHFLVSVQDSDGKWRSGNSAFADGTATLYNARVAWALAEAGVALNEPGFIRAAAKKLQAVARLQHMNGWIPRCCLTDPERPLLHTLAYTIRGLLEGGRVLGDDGLIRSAELAAGRLLDAVAENGWMAGRFQADWTPGATWSCLTGEAQMVSSWIRLYEIRGDRRWLDPVSRVLRFIKSTQNRVSSAPGLRGGIKGSSPVEGDYGSYEILNWATKFFIDALIRHDRVQTETQQRSFQLA